MKTTLLSMLAITLALSAPVLAETAGGQVNTQSPASATPQHNTQNTQSAQNRES